MSSRSTVSMSVRNSEPGRKFCLPDRGRTNTGLRFHKLGDTGGPAFDVREGTVSPEPNLHTVFWSHRPGMDEADPREGRFAVTRWVSSPSGHDVVAVGVGSVPALYPGVSRTRTSSRSVGNGSVARPSLLDVIA